MNVREYLDSLSVEDRAWQQGYLRLCGLQEKQTDVHTCRACGFSYEVRRQVHFRRDMTTEYLPDLDPGCPKCAKATGHE
jgi:hypothetical protein